MCSSDLCPKVHSSLGHRIGITLARVKALRSASIGAVRISLHEPAVIALEMEIPASILTIENALFLRRIENQEDASLPILFGNDSGVHFAFIRARNKEEPAVVKGNRRVLHRSVAELAVEETDRPRQGRGRGKKNSYK